MPLPPLRQPAAPVQDAPRKLSTPQQPAQRQSGLHQSSLNRGPHTANRRSNPALESATGQSGFDGRPQRSGRPELSPQLESPQTAGANFSWHKPGQAQGGTAPAGTQSAQGASGTEAVGGKPPADVISAMFTKASKSVEDMLSILGQGSLPEIEDPAERLTQRSNLLSSLIDQDPTRADAIPVSLKAQFYGELQVLSAWNKQGWLDQGQILGLQAGMTASAKLGWQPPQS